MTEEIKLWAHESVTTAGEQSIKAGCDIVIGLCIHVCLSLGRGVIIILKLQKKECGCRTAQTEIKMSKFS
jgi:hypothetical protein